jgi:hypothetical protein
VRTPELTPPPPCTPPAPTDNTSGAQPSGIVNLLTGYTYLHPALPGAEFLEDDQDTEHDTNVDPDMLTDNRSYAICCVVMRLTFILKTKAVD